MSVAVSSRFDELSMRMTLDLLSPGNRDALTFDLILSLSKDEVVAARRRH